MKINRAKCKVLSPSSDNVTIDRTHIESVDEFVFLGSALPDWSSDISQRIALASRAFGRPKNGDGK